MTRRADLHAAIVRLKREFGIQPQDRQPAMDEIIVALQAAASLQSAADRQHLDESRSQHGDWHAESQREESAKTTSRNTAGSTPADSRPLPSAAGAPEEPTHVCANCECAIVPILREHGPLGEMKDTCPRCNGYRLVRIREWQWDKAAAGGRPQPEALRAAILARVKAFFDEAIKRTGDCPTCRVAVDDFEHCDDCLYEQVKSAAALPSAPKDLDEDSRAGHVRMAIEQLSRLARGEKAQHGDVERSVSYWAAYAERALPTRLSIEQRAALAAAVPSARPPGPSVAPLDQGFDLVQNLKELRDDYWEEAKDDELRGVARLLYQRFADVLDGLLKRAGHGDVVPQKVE